MIFLKQACLCALILFLAGCTPLAVEAPDLTSDADSTEPAQESSMPTHQAGENAEGTIEPSDSFLIEIEFIESAPKDRFIMRNMGSCVLEELVIEFDLSQSVGMLIFDTSATGAGVEVFQPFEVVEGDIVQLAADGVDDGDVALALNIANLGPGDTASFSIDVDDTLPSGELGQIRVTDSEIRGGIVHVTVGDSEAIRAEFDDGSIARANLPACPSDQ